MRFGQCGDSASQAIYDGDFERTLSFKIKWLGGVSGKIRPLL